MQLEQTFTLPQAPEQVWPAFLDLDLLVDCLPGASIDGPIVDNEVPLRFEVKLGPISAAFSGKGSLSTDDADYAGQFQGSAVDRRTNTRVKGVASFVLAEEPAASTTGTLVKVTIDYSLAGSLAQFGRPGIVRELADSLTAEFAQRLRARLDVSEPEAAAGEAGETDKALAEPTSAARDQTAIHQSAQSISVLGLVGASLRRIGARWLARLTGRQI